MTEPQYYQKLKTIVSPYLPDDVSVDEIGMDSHFLKELNINSANLVDIVLDVEDEFDIVLENEDMEAMQTVRDAMVIIERKRSS
ncbi:MAG: acyl carrier protein [Flavobacteriaceae bacterium]|nr:acyl carrier protein [Flavobacteriaceae bacterium]